MNVRKLSTKTVTEVLECFLLAFEGYYVKMPTDHNYYKARWKAAGVDFNLSYGMFDEDKLVAFIIHAVDNRAGKLTAFNTGTGVLPEYRGRRIVKSIYEYALNDLLQNGIERSTLEVITKNEKAVRAYQAVGFKISKNYHCFAGEIAVENTELFELKGIALSDVDWAGLPNQQYYSWDFQKETILARNYAFYHVLNEGKPESYFIIGQENHYLAQFDLLNHQKDGWERLFSAIKQVSPSVKIINVDDRQTGKLEYIQSIGLPNTVDQYEMELDITI